MIAAGEPVFASARVDELIPDAREYAAAYAAAPEWRRRKADSFRFEADRRRSLAAWMLLEQLVAARGVSARALGVREGEFGKPEFADAPIAFNLSHGGDRVLAVVGASPVGCDVERVSRARPEIVERCFAAAERAYVGSFPEGAARDAAFCRVWVRKEAYVKAVGRGLDLDFRTFSAAPGEFPPSWTCRDLDFGDGHLGAVVSRGRG